MLKVLIVDDEILFRTNLKVMTQWENQGFILCKDAENGFDALEVIKNEKPDIVISDVRMPVMDGIQLSREIRNNYPDILLIILSNYDDYEYVRSTLKNGAVDYILKHKIDESVLLESLSKARETITKLRKKGEDVQYKESLYQNSIKVIKEKFITQLLTGTYSNEEEILYHLKVLNIKLDTRNVVAVLMAIDDYANISTGKDIKDNSHLALSVINISEEILYDFGYGVISHIGNGRFVILLSFSHMHSAAAFEGSISSTLSRIRSCLNKFINITVSFSIGRMCKKISDISESYKNAENLLKDRFYIGRNCTLRNNSLSQKVIFLKGLTLDEEKELLSLIKLNDKKGLMLKLEEVFQKINTINLNFTSSHIIFNDLIGIINRICKEKSIELSKVFSNSEAPHLTLSKLETLDDIKRWIIKLYDNLLVLGIDNKGEINSQYIKKAINYLKDHYTENISLEDIAAYLNLTNNYISKLFKEELGVGFSEYLCEMRLNRAKALLSSGKVYLKDVAGLCGFNTYTYFFSVFKKKTGITPKEYIDETFSSKGIY